MDVTVSSFKKRVESLEKQVLEKRVESLEKQVLDQQSEISSLHSTNSHLWSIVDEIMQRLADLEHNKICT